MNGQIALFQRKICDLIEIELKLTFNSIQMPQKDLHGGSMICPKLGFLHFYNESLTYTNDRHANT